MKYVTRYERWCVDQGYGVPPYYEDKNLSEEEVSLWGERNEYYYITRYEGMTDMEKFTELLESNMEEIVFYADRPHYNVTHEFSTSTDNIGEKLSAIEAANGLLWKMGRNGYWRMTVCQTCYDHHAGAPIHVEACFINNWEKI